LKVGKPGGLVPLPAAEFQFFQASDDDYPSLRVKGKALLQAETGDHRVFAGLFLNNETQFLEGFLFRYTRKYKGRPCDSRDI
jgi:hypothetical protein